MEPADEIHRAALGVLYEATGDRGLPMPGGFLLDPVAIAQRVTPPPQPPWVVFLGYHPRFGALLGSNTGGASLYPLHRPATIYSSDSHTLGREGRISRDWPGLLDCLFAIEDACACAYALWVRVGEKHGVMRPLDDHWRVLGDVIDGARASHIQSIATVLRAEPLFDYARQSFQARDREAFIVASGTDVFVASHRIEDLNSVLEYATLHSLPAQPESRGGVDVDEDVISIGTAAAYRLEAAVPAPGRSVRVVQDGEDHLWACFQGDSPYRRKRVSPGHVPKLSAAVIEGASPRLNRFFGRHGVSQAPALRSVEGVAKWVGQNGYGKDWSVLVDIERDFGGMLMTPEWGLTSPDRMGPWLMLQEAETLRGLNVMVDPEDADRFERREWPLLKFDGVELALIGLTQPRIDSAWAADAEGMIYFIDHEFLTLTLHAESVLKVLERRALRLDLYGNGLGIASKAALGIAEVLPAPIVDGLGLVRVEEASDAVTDTYLLANESAKLDVHKKRGQTTLYAHDIRVACDVAQAMREQFPDAPIHVLTNSGDPIGAARKRALTNAKIPGLDFRTWYTFPQ